MTVFFDFLIFFQQTLRKPLKFVALIIYGLPYGFICFLINKDRGCRKKYVPLHPL